MLYVHIYIGNISSSTKHGFYFEIVEVIYYITKKQIYEHLVAWEVLLIRLQSLNKYLTAFKF